MKITRKNDPARRTKSGMKIGRIVINGLRLRVNTWGTPRNRPLFFVHGWMDTGASFDFVCRHLKDRFFCIAPDLRGFGKSAHDKNPLGTFFYEYVADLYELLEKFSPDEPVDVVGHSMGGNILSFYAGAFPERVRSFVNIEGFGIADMPPETGPQRMRQWIEQLGRKRFKIYPSKKEIAERLARANPQLSQEQVGFLLPHLTRRAGGGFSFSADPRHKAPHPYLFQLANFLAFVKQIRCRCLLVAAEKTKMDNWIKSNGKIGEEIKRRMDYYPAGSQKVILPGCGHMVHHERPEELAKMVSDFVQAT